MAKWKRVPPHRNPNYERVGVVRCFDDSLRLLPEVSAFALEHEAVLVVGPRGTPLKPVYRKKTRA